ncbi:ABC transporter permease [Virgibacillus siamensis]|uniref:ABC transporter permease n=1 Tax=Virgibacillus siamensis TaxID=480071 RepID=UPI000984CC2C|nr:ABC transporter permease [Virgibacillus siamensis]
MRNAMKVAKWEIKRNMKNKSFLIGLFLTPVIFLGFMFFGSLFSDDSEPETTSVFIHDELNLYNTLQKIVEQQDLNWDIQKTDIGEDQLEEELADAEHTAYIFLTGDTLNSGTIPVYTSDDMENTFMQQVQILTGPIRISQLKQSGLSDEQLAAVSKGIHFKETSAEDIKEGGDSDQSGPFSGDALERVVPVAFAGIILLSIVFSGMYIFQSASNEKKDKIAEIILSSLTPGELMQGKIIGYFILGMFQAVVFLAFAVPISVWKLDVPILEYLLVPELILYIFIAILGYFLFAAIFVGVGATMADMTATGNFQGMVMMLPFLPFVFIGPVISDAAGLVAQIGSYIPFTAPGVLLLRLAILDDIPTVQIIISLVILLVSIWICMKIAGKIFKTGILMYGKNATPAEIWKWIRA